MWIRGAAIVTGRVVAGMLLGLASRACPMLNGASHIGFGALADDGADAVRTVGLRREDGPIRAGRGGGGEQHQLGNSQARKRPDRMCHAIYHLVVVSRVSLVQGPMAAWCC